MPPWGLRWLKLFLNPYADDDFDHIDESDRRKYIFERLEGSDFSESFWVVVVAGVGFFTDAYSIFAINMVIPMLGIIYYGDPVNKGTMPHNYEIALSVVTLGGSIIGQIAFGLGADLYGRRKMYGLELMITIFATLGVVMSSSGIEGSMSIIVWLLVWRFVLGIGIGSDYPLSSVITAEFAPHKLRGRMMTAVFMCQPLGQLAATLVSLIAAASQRNSIPADATPENCTGECLKTMDSIWRWIVGVGVIPAVIALWFRLTIIESPRYTADVGRDSKKAASELSRYLPSEIESAAVSTTSIEIPPQFQFRGSTMNGNEQTSSSESRKNNGETLGEIHLEDQILTTANDNKPPPVPSWEDFKDYFWYKGNLRTLLATSMCWFCVDLPFYGLGMNSPHIISTIWHGIGTPPQYIYPILIDDIAAELFPTRYRALSHGISAAFGKLGSVIAQLFLAYVNYGHNIDYNRIQLWLPYSLLIFSIFMLLGLLITIFYIPTPELGSDGVKTLEEWEVGRPANGFSKTWVARTIAGIWRWSSRSWDGIVGLIDRDEGERRRELREVKEEKRMRGNEDMNGEMQGNIDRD
ncbi:putative phosphate permease protein [Botrytis cinerea BcDW1]|uniref:Putative phosphate permease protein n=1 Tax=Botryotinia fuckeliana (strain BcDW1) TaxID=1290391 RepID=M7TTX4_BOTF1|nr:putative phosphate permease protein [Botrytis cinerea BcDW1]